MSPSNKPGRVLVSDFDGTMTQHDFYKLAIESLLPADVPDYWAEYRTGMISHFEALRRYFAAIRASEEQVLAVVERMELDPALPAAIQSLQQAGWSVVVTSAGCDWYIRQLLSAARVDIVVHANPGSFVQGQGLLMRMPIESPFFSPALGVDKMGVVHRFLKEGQTVAFAGDGYPDADPARLVSDDLRFARGDLADLLRGEGLPFHSYGSWSEIARYLLQRGT
jgi:2-hydroxy-3-keto-5-methylthiopentenyl-1-phosphate phosphatase